MKYTGKALCVGEHIDTDAIIPACYLVTTDPKELGSRCMAGMDPEWIKKVSAGDIMVAGRNFGCGSSREHAPIAILGAGIPVVIAHSFARIFYRNAFNMGLLPLEIGDAADGFSEGDVVEIDMDNGKIANKTTGKVIDVPALPVAMRNILENGGLAANVAARLGN